MGNRSKRLTAVLVVAMVVAIAGSDAVSNTARAYWVDHAMISSIVSGLVLLTATVVVLDEVLARRDAAKYRVFATQARRAVEERVREVVSAIEWHYNDSPDLPRAYLRLSADSAQDEREVERAEQLATRDEWRSKVLTTSQHLLQSCEYTLTAWSPVLLSHPELVSFANRFANVVERLRFLTAAGPGSPGLGRQFLELLDEARATQLWVKEFRPLTYRPSRWRIFKLRVGLIDPVDFEENPTDWYKGSWKPRKPEDFMVRGPIVMPPPPSLTDADSRQ